MKNSLDSISESEIPNIIDKSGLKFSYINIRSLYHKVCDLLFFINENNIDVIFMVETWLNDTISSTELHTYFINFSLFRIDRDLNRGGGILVLISSKYIAKLENSQITPELEILHVSIELNNRKSLEVVTLYRPPEACIKESNEKLNYFLSNINYSNLPFLFIGDFNVCIKLDKLNNHMLKL